MDKVIKELLKEMPEELKEMLGLEKDDKKKIYKEVAKINHKELAKFIENRSSIESIKAMIEALADIGNNLSKKDKEWWENITDKYNLSGTNLRVNREKMIIEEAIRLEAVKKNNPFN